MDWHFRYRGCDRGSHQQILLNPVTSITDQLIRDLKLRAAPRILIVEDDASDAELISGPLKELGCKCDFASTAFAAENMLYETTTSPTQPNFDIVFLDLKLPDRSGAELLRAIRKISPSLPVVIVTGYPDSEMLRNATQLGYVGLIKKPLARPDIEEIFDKHKIPFAHEL